MSGGPTTSMTIARAGAGFPAPARLSALSGGVAVGLLAAALAAIGAAPVVRAHGETVTTDPAPGSVVGAAPAAVTVTVSAPLAPGSEIQVLDAGFRRVDAGPTRLDPAVPARMAVDLALVGPGDYTVQWTALDADDGHRTAGSFVFQVADVQVATGAPADAALGAGGVAPADNAPEPGAVAPAGDVSRAGVAHPRATVADSATADPAPAPGGSDRAAFIAILVVFLATTAAAARRRRAVHAGWLLGLALAAGSATACAAPATITPPSALPGGGPTPAGLAGMSTAESGGVPAQIVIASSDLAVGRQRFAFGILDAAGALVQDADVVVTFFKLIDEDAVPVQALPATFYPSRLAAAGLYVVYTEFDAAGTWGAEIASALPDGTAAPPQRVRFTVAQLSAAPAVGETPPALANRTLTTEPDLARLTSDPVPDVELYRLTVDEARASGKPTVVLFATPNLCQSKVCGPVLDEIKQLKATWGDRVNFIHIEVYKSFDPLVYDDAMAAWNLQTEPWVFVLGRDGKVAERMEGSVTTAELEPFIERVTE